MSKVEARDERLEAARTAADEHRWHDALTLLRALDAEAKLEPEDLELLGETSWFGGDGDGAIEARERAFSAYQRQDRPERAAIVALQLSRDQFNKGNRSVATGWLSRADRLLDGILEGRAHGYLALAYGRAAHVGGHLDQTEAQAKRAREIGQRVGDPDLIAFGLMLEGMAAVARGDVDEGLALLDEATVAAVSGDVTPFTTGVVYCNVIGTCRDLADYRRAGEWTEAAKRWCERQSITGFPGVCRVHRAEIMALRGAWKEAEEEALLATEELVGFNSLGPASEGFYAIGEIRLRMGDLEGAESAFRQAHETGRTPQPGLALLRLAQGKLEAAVSSIRAAVADQSWDRLARARLLPAQVEIALAAGDVATARTAGEELSDIVSTYGSPALHAVAGAATGALLVAEGRGVEAVAELTRARRHAQEVDLPYEVARIRVDLARAHRLAGDPESATLELEAARTAFAKLGASNDVEAVDRLLRAAAGSAGAERAERAFVFTDIVGSTQLLELIGDGAWQDLRDWHDERVRALVARSGGEVVNHTGDGFFLAFPDTGAAIEFAVGLQRALADHRHTSGFAPRVRIGVHAAEAAKHTEGYLGKGVHAAARVGALAGAEEILVSYPSLPTDDLAYPLGERRSVELKGLSEPIEVVTVDWRGA